MQNKLTITKLTMLTALSGALIACSSDSGNVPNPSTIPTGKAIGTTGHAISGSMKGKISTTDPSKAVSGTSYYHADVKGNTIDVTLPYAGDIDVKVNGSSGGDWVMNSLFLEDASDSFEEMIAVAHISFIGKDGKPISVYDSINTGFSALSITPIASDDATWSWSNVNYSYSIATTDTGFEAPVLLIQDDDGTIEYNGATWTADFGEVSLVGTLDGYEVSGTAVLDFVAPGAPTLTGDFAGLDGVAKTPDGNLHGTMGGFAGEDSGQTTSFAGAWFQLE